MITATVSAFGKCFKISPLISPDSLIERVFADGVYAVIDTFPTADVAPKSEVAREILSDLKKAVHDKAVYSYSKEMYPYINLKVFDAVVADYLKRLEGKNYEN